jgi:serine/threonine protein kinase
MCAPNDVWSLGVILVNLTCGRNPWKQASFQDSTYRAFARSSDFLKTILPITDELNSILGQIFNIDPEQRISLPELRKRILVCSKFTIPQGASVSPPATPEQVSPYVIPEDAVADDFEYEAALSPASTNSDEGSLTSSGSTIDDLDEDFMHEQQDVSLDNHPAHLDGMDPKTYCHYTGHEFVPQHYAGPVPSSMVGPPQMNCHQVPVSAPVPIQAPIPVQAPCQPRSYFALLDMVKYVQMPIMQHPMPFYQQAPILSFQGCF